MNWTNYPQLRGNINITAFSRYIAQLDNAFFIVEINILKKFFEDDYLDLFFYKYVSRIILFAFV